MRRLSFALYKQLYLSL